MRGQLRPRAPWGHVSTYGVMEQGSACEGRGTQRHVARKALWSLRRRVFRLAHRETESKLLRASRETRPETALALGLERVP